MKIVRVIFSSEAEEIYKYLNQKSVNLKQANTILNAIHQKTELIKANYHYGNPIAKNLIPEEYKVKYGVTNLFRVELPNFWRMLYTLTDGETDTEIITFILDIIDHEEYDKKFKYRKK